MRSFQNTLYSIISDQELKENPVVSWNSDGGSFIIWDRHAFVNVVIPSKFRHKTWKSFQRQLNLYGFKSRLLEVSTTKRPAVKPKIYRHQMGYFHRDQPELLKLLTTSRAQAREAKQCNANEKQLNSEKIFDHQIFDQPKKTFDHSALSEESVKILCIPDNKLSNHDALSNPDTILSNPSCNEKELQKPFSKRINKSSKDFDLEFSSFLERPWESNITEIEDNQEILDDFIMFMGTQGQ